MRIFRVSRRQQFGLIFHPTIGLTFQPRSNSMRLRTCSLILAVGVILTTSLLAQDESPASPAPPNVIPQGSILLIQLTDRLDTHSVKAGDRFHARLAEPFAAANGMTLDQGRKIKGHISAVEPGLHTRLLLSFDEIDTGHGWAPLIATVTGVPGEHGLRPVGEEGEIGRKGMTKEEIAEAVVIGAGEGAAQGAHEGGKKGAAKGAAAGAANSAYSGFESGHDLVLDKGTALEVRLDRNLSLR
jgi:hypothetical protein